MGIETMDQAEGRMADERAEQLDRLKELVYAGDNHECFVERETLLPELTREATDVPGPHRYAAVLSAMLERISTPIDEDDVILGRMVEGPTGMTDAEVEETRWQDFCHQEMLIGPGHLTLDWEELIHHGLGGVARKARAKAEKRGTDRARLFAENAERCADAVRQFACRYAAAARQRGEQLSGVRRENMLRAARALDVVPHGPAPDFFSALQGIWLVHLLTSCIIGGRDYAFGRMDQYLLELYERDVANGVLDRETALWFMSNFLLKCNEITGTSSQHHKPKPVPSAGSKQYLILGGCDAHGRDCSNPLSALILDAVSLVELPQPVVVARIGQGTEPAFLERSAQTTLESQGLIHFMNDVTIVPGLLRKGIEAADAYDYGARGCSTVDLPARTACHDELINVTPWFLAVLGGGRLPGSKEVSFPFVGDPDGFQSVEDILEDFGRIARQKVSARLSANASNPEPYWECSFRNEGGPHFHFDALLLRDCVETGKLYCEGGIRYVLRICHFGSLATIADSLMTVKRLVFDEGRMTLRELMSCCENNFEGEEALRQEIINRLPKFGNDNDEVDRIARRVCEVLRDAVDSIEPKPGHALLSSMYTLINHNAHGERLPATPDGRLAGEPLSENHSPTYGADRTGITAMFQSVGKLPFTEMPSGGLNVKLASKLKPSKLASLIRAFFAEGGAVLGFTLVNRSVLEDARRRPEKYRSLLVRQAGFSEFFNALPPHEQVEIINRSEY